MIEATIPVSGPDQLIQLFGPSDQHLRRIRELSAAKITTRNGSINVSGDDRSVLLVTSLFERMKGEVTRDEGVSPAALERLIDELSDPRPTNGALKAPTNGVSGKPPAPGGSGKPPAPGGSGKIDVQRIGVSVRPRTDGQARYIETIRANEMVFCIGPAGTGKTYLAVAAAVESLKAGKIRKIVLVRPAVEAGESLGFLPGDLQAKINPYLRPLLDALAEMMDFDQLKRYMAEDVIEVAPLAYMRGRTLNNAFIILDEAQNTTVAQMKMFLTRMGADTRVVVSGDVSQVDLPPHATSGLIDARDRLQGIDGIGWVMLDETDIVRHRLVQAIVLAYEEQRRRSG